MALLDLLGRRMALRILWELRTDQLTFRELQDAAATNPAVLNVRLRELRAAGLVDHNRGGYLLTQHGAGLLGLLHPVGRWAEEWASRHGVDTPLP